MRSPRTLIGLVALVALLAVALGAARTTTAATPKPPIVIGIVAGLTGGSSTIGVPYVKGAQLSAQTINRRGGINGRKIELRIADNETQAVAGVQAALKLVNADKVHSLICSCFTVVFFPIAEALARSNIVITNNASSTPVVRTLPGHIVTSIPTDDVLGSELATWAYNLRFRRAAMLSVNDPYGSAFRDVVSKQYKKLGGQIPVDVVVDGGLPDYRPELRRIVDSGAKVLLMGTYTADARLQFRQLTQMGWRGIAFKLYPSATQLNLDPETHGRFFGLESTFVDSPAGKAWQARYKARWNEDPIIWSAVGYDAVWLNALGLANAANRNPATIKRAMVNGARTYLGPTGRIQFDRTFVRVKPSLAYYTIVRGQYVRVNAKGKVFKG